MWKLLVVGCNGIVRSWLNAMKDNAEIQVIALVDIIRERCEGINKDYGFNAEIFENMDEAFAKTKTNLVLDCTPPSVHRDVVIKALKSGRYVIGEKPMTDSMEAAKEILAVVDESGKSYFVMQNRRYLNGIQTLKQELAKTYLGRPYLITCDMFLGAHFMGARNGEGDFRNKMDHPVLIDMLIHTFDQARYIAGDRRAISAYCQELNPPNSWYKGDAIALCTFEFEDNIALSLRGSWATKCENTTAHGAWKVYCTDGTACWDGDQHVWVTRAQPVPGRGYFEEEGVREDITLSYKGREVHAGCVDAMLDALRVNGSMMTDCHNNIHSLAMVYACIKSSSAERKIYLKDIY